MATVPTGDVSEARERLDAARREIFRLRAELAVVLRQRDGLVVAFAEVEDVVRDLNDGGFRTDRDRAVLNRLLAARNRAMDVVTGRDRKQARDATLKKS